MRIGSAKFAPWIILAFVFFIVFFPKKILGAFNTGTVRRTYSLLLAFEYVVSYGINFCNWL
jgi:hypothetical protein